MSREFNRAQLMPTVGHLQLLASIILPQSAWPMPWGARTLHPHSLSGENLTIDCNRCPILQIQHEV